MECINQPAWQLILIRGRLWRRIGAVRVANRIRGYTDLKKHIIRNGVKQTGLLRIYCLSSSVCYEINLKEIVGRSRAFCQVIFRSMSVESLIRKVKIILKLKKLALTLSEQLNKAMNWRGRVRRVIAINQVGGYFIWVRFSEQRLPAQASALANNCVGLFSFLTMSRFLETRLFFFFVNKISENELLGTA